MDKLIFQGRFGNQEGSVEISQVFGIGTFGFHVYINKYYIAHIFLTEHFGWQWHTPDKAQLQKAEIETLIKIIEANFETK